MKVQEIRTLLSLLFIMIIMSFGMIPAFASDMEILDAKGNQLIFSKYVAEINLFSEYVSDYPDAISSAGYQNTNGLHYVQLQGVLCRTDGRNVLFEKWKPVCVIYGPKNCCMLYFLDANAAQAAAMEISALDGIRYAEMDGDVFASSYTDNIPREEKIFLVDNVTPGQVDENENNLNTERPKYLFKSWGAEKLHVAEYSGYTKNWGANNDITVAIVDSGVYLHSFLKNRILECGYDYVDSDWDSTNDLFGHGTNVAGIVADCTPNAGVYIYPIRVLNAQGRGKISNVANAVREATEKGVQIINLSIESYTPSAALDEAILDAVNEGITVVIAAGNSAGDTSQVYPAHLESNGVIVVGSVEEDGRRSSYSNYGNSVDLYAYGSNIECCSRNGDYIINTGTSMAAPHIAGSVAMLKQLHPELCPEEIEERLKIASSKVENIQIAELNNMIPSGFGFSLGTIYLDLEDKIQLSEFVNPIVACERVVYFSSDETILKVINGHMIPINVGKATVTARAIGLEDKCFDVLVTGDECYVFEVPKDTTTIGERAFEGIKATHIILPEGLEYIGENCFYGCSNLKYVMLPDSLNEIYNNTFSNAVILCYANSYGASYALKNGFPYLTLSKQTREYF